MKHIKTITWADGREFSIMSHPSRYESQSCRIREHREFMIKQKAKRNRDLMLSKLNDELTD